MEEQRDREMLIRIEQQLENASQNQGQILEDLRDIFKRLEMDSKLVTTVSGDLKAHMESSGIRWENMEKNLSELEKKNNTIEERLQKIASELGIEKEERIKAITEEREKRSSDNTARENFEREMKASFRLISWVLGAAVSIATIVSVLVALFNK